jgi:hypothetical protein
VRRFAALALLLLPGCQLAFGAGAILTSEVSVSPSVAVAGDTVALTVSTTNHGDRTLRVGYGCGEGLDFEVTLPDGSVRHLLRELASICPILDSNVLEAGETDTLRYRWQVPGVPGQYRVRGGIRVEHGIDAASAPVVLRVR